jgi:toxin ParE1/3/4
MKPQYNEQAANDLQQIERHYAERADAVVAENLIDRITSTLERLIARNPGAGRCRPELGPHIRSFPVLPYVVFYRVEGRRIFVLRIIHGHRDIRPPLASLLTAV